MYYVWPKLKDIFSQIISSSSKVDDNKIRFQTKQKKKNNVLQDRMESVRKERDQQFEKDQKNVGEAYGICRMNKI